MGALELAVRTAPITMVLLRGGFRFRVFVGAADINPTSGDHDS